MSSLLHLEEVDSTNTYLKNRQGALPHGTVVYADRQTAGRGRYNRVWVSKTGGLYFSVLLKPPYSPFLPNLTQLLALSICLALEDLGLKPAVKWPNDVQINGRKISGILSEAVFKSSQFQAVILGAGINISQGGLDQVGQPAVSLKELGIMVQPAELLDTVLHYFWQRYATLCQEGFETIRAAYTQRFAALGCEVRVQDGEQTIFGRAEDISSRGTLMLRTAQGLKEIYIGDLKV
ncbi:MAG: biotin--[Elusimicrobiaceae bacterium]|nr:biotin--[acetyl-CoA-carboxylase] ligase [Elusimicrobiaceae bacterium]